MTDHDYAGLIARLRDDEWAPDHDCLEAATAIETLLKERADNCDEWERVVHDLEARADALEKERDSIRDLFVATGKDFEVQFARAERLTAELEAIAAAGDGWSSKRARAALATNTGGEP